MNHTTITLRGPRLRPPYQTACRLSRQYLCFSARDTLSSFLIERLRFWRATTLIAQTQHRNIFIVVALLDSNLITNGNLFRDFRALTTDIDFSALNCLLAE